MAEPDEADYAIERLEQALARIAARQQRVEQAASPVGPDPRAIEKLDRLIEALRIALEA